MKILVLIFIIGLLTLPLVSARVLLKLESFCNSDGSLKLTVTNQGNEPVETSNLKMLFSYFHEDLQFVDLDLKGKWSMSTIFPKNVVSFTADSGYLKYMGRYEFKINYNDCGYSECFVLERKDCIGSTRQSFCTGKVDFKIDSCETKGSEFKLIFSGFDGGFIREIKKNMILYKFEGETTTYSTTIGNLPADFNVQKIAEDKYELTFTSDTPIKVAKLNDNFCGGEAYRNCAVKHSKDEAKVSEIEQSTQRTTLNLDSSKSETIAPTLVQVKGNEQKKSKVPLILSIIVIIALALGGIYYHNKHKGLNTKKTAYCDNCGAEIKKGDSFCEACGDKLK